MTPRATIVAIGRAHLDRLIQEELAAQGMAADLNHIDVSGILNFDRLFYNSSFNGNISKWNVSSVIFLASAFENSLFNGDISEWDVSKVTSMYETFRNSRFCGDLSRWNIGRVETMEGMFHGPNCKPTGLSHWNVSQVESFFRMFKNNPTVHDLSGWLPPGNAYAEAMIDSAMLRAAPAPCFYHWYRVLNDAKHRMNMPEHLIALPQVNDVLRPEWIAHFNAITPLATGLGLSGIALARFTQEQWVERQKTPLDVWPLPDMEGP